MRREWRRAGGHLSWMAIALLSTLCAGGKNDSGSPSTPTPVTTTTIPASATSGRIQDAQTVADLLTYHQDAVAGSSFRALGVIARWEQPVPVFVDPSASRTNVERSLAYWQSVTGVSFVIVNANQDPRILVRAGTDGLGAAGGRGLVDGVYADNRARSGLIVIRPELATCDFAQVSCAFLYEHEIGHTLGIFDHLPGGGLMTGGTRASQREINLMVELYRLPHGTRIEADGTWRVVR